MWITRPPALTGQPNIRPINPFSGSGNPLPPGARGPLLRARAEPATTPATQSGASEAASSSSPPSSSSISPPVPRDQLRLCISLVDSASKVGRAAWDACHDGANPFLSFDFIDALETSGSAVPKMGWMPQHAVVTAASYSFSAADGNPSGDGTPSDRVVAIVPMYLKTHSYGEYVFDNSWAEAYERSTPNAYYPKLQACVPFTPVTGPRLLIAPGPWEKEVRGALARGLPEVADRMGVSSLHVTFCTGEEAVALRAGSGGGGNGGAFLPRLGVQYHWSNGRPGGPKYASFADFEAALQQKRRKSVRQERRRVADSGLRVSRLTGDDVRASTLWDAFYAFYRDTTDRKWGTPYLTRDFFHQLGERMGDRVVLVVAEEESTAAALMPPVGMASGGRRHRAPVAAALNLQGTEALYGRNWGSLYGDSLKNLHFELCYYQAIEHAIERGLSRVEAGAQGEHKVQRGYLPELTYSCHYVADPGFAMAVDRFLQRERVEIEEYAEGLRRAASPYKENSL